MKTTLASLALLGLVSFAAAAAPVAAGNDVSFVDASVAMPGAGVDVELDVTTSTLPVPELSTAVLMLGGVGAVAFLALRRRGWRAQSSPRRTRLWSRS